MKIAVVLGTRPEIIKMAPVIRALEKRKADYFILHTGQHYSHNLDQVFFEQLHLPACRYNIEAGSGSHAEQTARILVGVEKVLIQEKPDIILVEGDTNSVLAGTLAAAKLHIGVGHVEAGLRSHDRQMPEEINRIVADHCSDYLFAPTAEAKANLLSEGIPTSKVFITGNTIVDSVYQNLEIAKNCSHSLADLHIERGRYLLVTLHRQENVDSQAQFQSILNGIMLLGEELKLPVIYPIHPHSRKRIKEFGFRLESINLIEPINFLDFLQLENNARLVLTDSGGVQEETCILGVPCVTLRNNTERPETIEVGANILAGTKPEKIIECSRVMLSRSNGWKNPFGGGRAGEIIVSIISGGIDG